MKDQFDYTTTMLPHETDAVFLMDGGIETTLIFNDGFDLPHFAAFPLLETETGRAALARYFRSYLDIARDHGVGFVLETPTWRASRDWGGLVGYDAEALDRINREAVHFVPELARAFMGCPGCGSADFDVTAGRGVSVASIEGEAA